MPEAPAALDGMVEIGGGRFLMGSDEHYAEEAAAHPVEVEPFWVDRSPVTNGEFAAFVAATGYVTVAERPLDPADFPGAPAENLVAGSLVFTPTPGPVDPRHPLGRRRDAHGSAKTRAQSSRMLTTVQPRRAAVSSIGSASGFVMAPPA